MGFATPCLKNIPPFGDFQFHENGASLPKSVKNSGGKTGCAEQITPDAYQLAANR
jgi:hypothetical protein